MRRLLARLFGPPDGEETPRPLWPHFDTAPIDWATIEADVRSWEGLLVPNGRGGYEWRTRPPEPSAAAGAG